MFASDAFFPSTAFAWTFCLVLMGITALASYTDFQRMTIPRP